MRFACSLTAGRDVRTGASVGSTSPTVASRLANRLRQQRAVRQIEIDSGWWEDRDLTVINRTWFRLDVRALVEEHGGGKCLYRLAVRSRLTAAVALPLLVAVGHGWLLCVTPGVSWSGASRSSAHSR